MHFTSHYNVYSVNNIHVSRITLSFYVKLRWRMQRITDMDSHYAFMGTNSSQSEMKQSGGFIFNEKEMNI